MITRLSIDRASSRRTRPLVAAETLESRRLLASVSLIKDLDASPDLGFSPESLVSVGSVAYFTQFDRTYGYELWKTDGTAAGTVMVKDIAPGKFGSWPRSFTAVGSTVYFNATTETAGSELWKTDGTAAGTVLVKDIVPGVGSSYPGGLRAVGSSLMFIATTPATGYEVFKSDGTVAGTNLVIDLRPGASGTTGYVSIEGRVAVAGSTYLFFGTNGTTSGVYRSDGTPAGTSLLKSNADYYPSSILSAGARAIITPAISNHGFLITDGTAAGTVAMGSDSTDNLVAVAGSYIYYFDYLYPGYALYRRTITGTTSTQLTLPSGVGIPVDLIPFGNSVVFTAPTNLGGTDLYQATSTSLGATLLRNFAAYDNQISNPVTIGSTLYFINESTSELWKSNGTAAGTSVVTAINPATPTAYSAAVSIMAGVNSRLVLSNTTAATGAELWSTDGTAANFAILKDIDTATAFYGRYANYLGRLGNVLFYRADYDGLGTELYKTDGTAAGTSRVADIEPGQYSSIPQRGATVNGYFLFSAENSANGREIWRTDGTTAGTSRVLDINPGAADGADYAVVEMNGIAYFAGTDANGTELWRSDGTAAGTYRVADLVAGSGSSSPTSLIAYNGKLYFAATTNTGTELFISDGTAAGTVLLKDLYAGSSSGSPANFNVAGGLLFFSAADAAGVEPWRTDGTPAGTVRVADLATGTASSNANSFSAAGDVVYFEATTPATGYELYKLNLVTGQVTLAVELTAGTASGQFTNFTSFAGDVYFAGNGELFKAAADGSLTQLTQFIANGDSGILNPYGSIGVANGALFFNAYSTLYNSELYTYDGRPGSTIEFNDLASGVLSSGPGEWASVAAGTVMPANTPDYGGEFYLIADTYVPRVYRTSYDVNANAIYADFSEAISLWGGNATTLINTATGQPVPGVTIQRQIVGDGSRVRFAFSGTLPDGNYRLSFANTDYRDGANNAGAGTQSIDFFVLAGDVNHDRSVNFDDLLIVAQNYGQAGKSFGQGNLNYSADGKVDFDDLLILAQKYGTSVLQAEPVATPAKTKRRAVEVLA